MTAKNKKAIDEEEIRRRIADWIEAVHSKDVDRIMSHYAPDILSFDLAPPLLYKGADRYRKNWEEWVPTFQGPIGYEIHDLCVFAGDDVAFSHSLNRITGTRTDGEQTDVWIRATLGYRRIHGRWMITHEHFSVPFDMVTYKALLNLKPS